MPVMDSITSDNNPFQLINDADDPSLVAAVTLNDVDDVDPDKITITDIDGNVVDCDLDMNEFEIFESNCPLIAYNREQSELKKALFEQCAK